MDIRQLKYLVRIIDRKSFAKAADETHIAPSALGVQIRNLEEELGIALLTRHARGVEPTEAGRLLYQRAHDVLRLLEQSKHELSQLKGDHPVIRVTVGLCPPINDLLSAMLLQRVRETHADVLLSIVESPSQTLWSSVRERQLDIACIYDAATDPAVNGVQLAEDEMVFIQRATETADLSFAPISLHEVAKYPLVLPAPSHAARMILDQHALEHRVRLNVIFELQSSAAVRDLVQRGEAAALVPFASVARYLEHPQLHVRRLEGPAIKRPLWLIRPRKPQDESTTAMVDSIGGILQSLLREQLSVNQSGHN